jgi:hypothetical protein
MANGVERRSGMRVHWQIPIQLHYKEAGRPLIIPGQTIDVSVAGCFVLAPQALSIGQQVRIKNQVNGISCEAEIVRHGQGAAVGWHLGIRFLDWTDEFWGLQF